MKRKYEIAVVSKGAYARTLRIYAPKKADRAVIMHDGQNVFYDSDASYGKSWRALDALKASGIKNTAIIGIDSTATRMDDYLPFETELADYVPISCGGKADLYVDYIETRVIPYLTERFGFKMYAMLGSSAGALATLCFAEKNHNAFKAYGMYSTPLFVSAAAYEKHLKEVRFAGGAFYHVYTGGSESTTDKVDAKIESGLFVNDAFKLVNALRDGGATNIKLDLDGLSVHDENSWRAPEKIFFDTFSKM